MFDIWNRRYTGSKYKLSQWIHDLIIENCHGDSFCDIFAGTGVISYTMINDMKNIAINDFLYSNEIIYTAFFSNEKYDTNKIEHYKLIFKNIDSDDIEENYVSVNFGNKFFSVNDAKKIGYIREYIEENSLLFNHREKAILIASILYSADKSANTVGHYDAYIKGHDIPDRFQFDLIYPYSTKSDIHIYRENARIEYIIENYSSVKEFSSRLDYFEYISQIDANILSIAHSEPVSTDDIKEKTIVEWAKNHSKEYIYNELNIACGRNESKDSVLKIIDKPTRFEFLVSIALKQQFENLIVKPNYKADDEGIPTFTAAGGMADIECFDLECNPLVEVTLMNGRTQATNEIPAITRHLNEAVEKYHGIKVFTVFVAPTIHTDTIYMAKFSKWQYYVDILTFNVSEFIDKIKSIKNIVDILVIEQYY